MRQADHISRPTGARKQVGIKIGADGRFVIDDEVPAEMREVLEQIVEHNAAEERKYAYTSLNEHLETTSLMRMVRKRRWRVVAHIVAGWTGNIFCFIALLLMFTVYGCRLKADVMKNRDSTPLMIACWGTAKPAADKDIIEALLMWAEKNGKGKDIRDATDASAEACTAADLARARRDQWAAAPTTGEDGPGQEEKRKYDKIVEWLEKGLPTN